MARRAGVSTGTVSTVLNRPETVPAATRATVELAMVDLGYARGVPSGDLSPHWRRNNFADRLFHPAITGRYPTSGRPAVTVLAQPWPGVPVRGRGAAARADACWLPVAAKLTPHSLRHSYKTFMEELGRPGKLMDEQMGHANGSVQALYSHVTAVMVDRLLDGLTGLWSAALDARRALCPSSPVAALDRLLAAPTGEERP